MSTGFVCWNCGTNIDDVPRPISRHASCGTCFNELHCCRMCKHYDPKRTMQCFEDRADPPIEKGNANFCDFFALTRNTYNPDNKPKVDDAKAKLDELFGASGGHQNEEQASEESSHSMADTINCDANSKDAQLTPAEIARRKLEDLF